jgi:hypothetical protein
MIELSKENIENFFIPLFGLMAKYGLPVYWNAEDDELKPWLLTNDVFFWACADGVDITPDNFEVLVKAFEECVTLEPERGATFADLLFATRVNKMRPQGAFYSIIPETLWPLFNNSAPYREVDFGNPYEIGAYVTQKMRAASEEE